MAESRVVISRAALLVKVTAKIPIGVARPLANSHATRVVSTRVLPLPAPAKTIDRIVDVFPAEEKDMVRAMLSESLRAVISQTLLKTKDGEGRVAAHEIMIGTPAIRNLIRENKVAQMFSTLQTGQAQGMQTLDQSLAELVRRNLITVEEARTKATNKDAFL